MNNIFSNKSALISLSLRLCGIGLKSDRCFLNVQICMVWWLLGEQFYGSPFCRPEKDWLVFFCGHERIPNRPLQVYDMMNNRTSLQNSIKSWQNCTWHRINTCNKYIICFHISNDFKFRMNHSLIDINNALLRWPKLLVQEFHKVTI